MIEIKLENVFRSFSGGMALNGVSETFPAGSFTSVIGPSGAGKSTLLRCINGMERADSGRVLAGGTDMASARGRELRSAQRRIGTIWQDFCLVEPSTALDNVLNGALAEMSFFAAVFGLFGRGRTAKARALLERVGLAHKAGQRASSLSGGEKQRCAIARALMQGCEAILADEPVASLDPVHAENVLSLLKKLQREEGATVIMNSHNVEQARSYADRIVGLRVGRVVFSGAPDELSPAALRDIYGDEIA